ncbi:MAG: GNAT family N-acetyltransferase [Thermoplasmata archaeon]|jgi:ribosomal protein S18 acetylase RimI-like enzyme
MEILPTDRIPEIDLVERLHGMLKALRARGESPQGDWVEGVARELHQGLRIGRVARRGSSTILGFLSTSDGGAFGHLHAEGPADPELGGQLLAALIDAVPAEVTTLVVGFTGLEPAEEALVIQQVGRPGGCAVARRAMVRPIGPADHLALAPPVPTARRLPVREVPLPALALLDQRAYAGTVDALLTGPEPVHHERILDELLHHRLGRLLDEASMALVEVDTGALVGLILTAEISAHAAVLLDVAVEPMARRKGYGRFLLQWTFRALRALGYEEVRLWVTEENRTARHLYDQLGFRPAGRATLYRWERGSGQPHSGA